MSLFAILFALMLEQVRPLTYDNPVYTGVRAWAQAMQHNFDAGQRHHQWVVWALSVGMPTVAVLMVYWLLTAWLHPIAGAMWTAAVIYFTVGFRQFSHHFTGIRDALGMADERLARERLAQWQQVDASELPRSEIVRHVIEYSVLAAHRHVFGVLTWFCIFAVLGFGPAGAVFYRMSEFVARYMQHRRQVQKSLNANDLQPLDHAAVRAWRVVDWFPARMTAVCFAIVGSFEDAIDHWREHSKSFPGDNDGVIVSATSGAVNVRLGGSALKPVQSSATLDAEPYPEDTESMPGREPEIAHLAQVVGLVWRSVVLWVGLVGLLTFVKLLG